MASAAVCVCATCLELWGVGGGEHALSGAVGEGLAHGPADGAVDDAVHGVHRLRELEEPDERRRDHHSAEREREGGLKTETQRG